MAVDAQLSRLDDSRAEVFFKNLLIRAPFVDGLICAIFALWTILYTDSGLVGTLLIAIGFFILHCSIYFIRDTRRLRWDDRFNGGLSWVYAMLSAMGIRLIGPNYSLSMGFAIRFYMATIAALGGFLASTPTLVDYTLSMFLLYLGVWIYCLFWGPAALYADKYIHRPSILHLPFLPLVASWRFLAKIFQIDTPWHVLFKKAYKALALIAGVVIIMVGINFILSNIPERAMTVFVIFFMCVFMVLFIVMIFRGMWRRWHDHVLLGKLTNGNVKSETFSEILDVLGKINTDRGLILFMEHLKRQNVGYVNPQTLDALHALSLVVRLGPKTGISERLTILMALGETEMQLYDEWFGKSSTMTNRLMESHSQAIRDEIGKIMAEVDAAPSVNRL